MTSELLFTVIIALTALERLYELYLTRRNAQWSFDHGGKEYGQNHYPFMVLLHTGFLVACVLEVYFFERQFIPVVAGVLIILAVLCQVLRWWCITTLAYRWNARVIIVPGLARISGGPYRFFSHPNYVAVVAEGLVLPMIHGAYVTAIVFSVLNAILLTVRIKVENQALNEMEEKTGHFSDNHSVSHP